MWGNEHTIWHQHDKHRLAYQSLLSTRGQQIADRLGLGPAHLAHQCVGCHAPAALDEPNTAACMPSTVTEGVGCESCHGKAQGWFVAHTAADWAMLSPIEKEAIGFRNTKDLTARAGICSECHVGSAKGDVNHDLIAAGHPRLTFEFASHLHRLPLHWDEKGENDRQLRPAFEARAWTIGQIAAAKAHLELLALRAETSPVWPEFAEYSCYGCHRNLKPEVAPVIGKVGQPAWGTWHFQLLPLIGPTPKSVDPYLTDLHGVMEKLSADRIVAAGASRVALQELDDWLAAVSSDPPETPIRQQLALLAQKGPPLINGEWDIAAQLYLALCAWQQARLDVQQRITPEDQAIRKLLGDIRRDLYPPSADARYQRSIEQLWEARRPL